jgi:Lrp/AsnC family transcriptional regulator for asnA, asnC and gidA
LPFQKPDAVDMHILSILEDNGRATNREIAEAVGVSEGTVRNRIERLMRDDVLRIVGVTNPARLGLNTAAVISISAELSRITSIAERIAEAPGVVYVGYSTGNADIIALAFFPSNDDLTDFTTQTLAAIPGIRRTPTSSPRLRASSRARGRQRPATQLRAVKRSRIGSHMIRPSPPSRGVVTYDHHGPRTAGSSSCARMAA